MYLNSHNYLMNIQRNMQNGISIMCALIILGFVACRCLLFLAYIHSNVLQAVLDTHSVHQLLDYDGKRSAQGDFVTMSWSNGEHTWACTSQWCVHWPLDILVFIPGICIASILCNQVEIAQPQLKVHTHADTQCEKWLNISEVFYWNEIRIFDEQRPIKSWVINWNKGKCNNDEQKYTTVDGKCNHLSIYSHKIIVKDNKDIEIYIVLMSTSTR